MNNNIQIMSEQLIHAFSLVMNPYTPVQERNEAHKIIENFKDTSPHCVECGFYLSSSLNPPIIRHFGLSLIKHHIDVNWNKISWEEKLNIKNNILERLSKDISISEAAHVKDALSRIVVEMIKREWPQQWPSLLKELHNICIIGDVQTELVLMIFLRLAEDIVQFQNVPDKRRRDVYKGLCMHLNDLFLFFSKTLTDQCEKYYTLKNVQMDHDMAINHCHIVQVALETIAVYLEWVPINHITEDPVFFKKLCHLLHDEHLQINTVKCLLSLADRKGKPEDRIPILKLLDEIELLQVCSQIRNEPITATYLFVKLLSQTLSTLGSNLSFLMGQFDEVKEPEHFPLYLQCMLSFTKHPSLSVSHNAQNFWIAILRDKNLNQKPAVQAIIPDLLKYEAQKLFKIGFPSKDDSIASKYSLLIYDSDEDFEMEFHKFRSEVCEVLKVITKIHPELAFKYGISLLKPVLNGQDCPVLAEMEDSASLDMLSVWDAIVHYFDAVCTSLIKNFKLSDLQSISTEGVELLQMTLHYKSEDLFIMSYVLSCTSALFFFANFWSDGVLAVFNRLFSNLTAHSNEDKNALPKDVLNLRRHTCALFIKLSCTQSKLLLPSLDHLCRCIKELMDMHDNVSILEKCNLLEVIMILSNELCDYDNQLKLLNEMVAPVISVWLTDDMKTITSSTDNFIPYVGLQEPPDSTNEITIKNRFQLLLCVNVIKTCAKRCRIVRDTVIAEKGQFIHPLSQTVNSVLFRNPSAQLLVPAFSNIFYLIRTLQALHNPAVKAKIHPGFLGVTEISETDKNIILGITSSDENKSKCPTERMKLYLLGIHDGCLHALGDSAENICIDFYMVPNLSNYFTDCVFHCLQYLPDDKIRLIIRTFLKPFFHRCPVDLCGNLVNVLSEFCNFMFQKLSTSWQKFKQSYGTSIGYEDQMTEAQEVFEDQLNRLLTREYISFLVMLLQSKPMLDSTDCQMEDDSREVNSTNQSKQLSELGLKILQTEAVRGIIVCTVFEGLHWLDTVTNIHCLTACKLIFNQLLKDGQIRQLVEANYLLQNSLLGLQELGEHESNQGLILSFSMHVYENLRPLFPEIRETFMACTGCDLITAQKVDSVLLRDGMEKSKKDVFKQAVQKIIGKNIGQYHKKNIQIVNLPPLFTLPKEKPSFIDSTNDVGICKLFEPSA